MQIKPVCMLVFLRGRYFQKLYSGEHLSAYNSALGYVTQAGRELELVSFSNHISGH